jgi:hypothetical protein
VTPPGEGSGSTSRPRVVRDTTLQRLPPYGGSSQGIATLSPDDHKDALGWRCQLHVAHCTNVPYYLADISGFLGLRTLYCSQRNRPRFFQGAACILVIFHWMTNDSGNICAKRRRSGCSIYTDNTPWYHYLNQIICTASILLMRQRERYRQRSTAHFHPRRRRCFASTCCPTLSSLEVSP